ncbi:NYN domain-containing protein [Patescibacteria group bacterium]|nr:NYN domain-containing protein [Patescibacteria group bacterium]MBU4481736.1 NYN domain-containing protein [Patescibacteria group bacterium]
MFIPKTQRIEEISKNKPEAIKQLESIFNAKVRVYIDYANVRPWSVKLGWHIDLKRLKQFLNSFDTIGDDAITFYNGYLAGNERSEKEKSETENCKYVLRTKPVKIIKLSIDASSILPDSTVLLDQFVQRALLKKYEISTIEYLNERFKDMNKKGEYFIENMKCNFDVEIGVDMLLDCERDNAETFALWSGDSDFADPVEKLMGAGKKVILFATARKVSKELSALVAKGLMIFDIQKIRDFICWKKELERKRDPNEGAPKL